MSERKEQKMGMTKRQSWAIKCASNLDVRDCDFTYEAASYTIKCLNESAEAYAELVDWLLKNGAKGTPKPFKKYEKKTKAMPRSKRVGTKVVNSRDAEFQAMLDQAVEAGVAAAEACTPTPMVVVQRANMLDDSSPIVKEYAPVMGGICGFARVELPGNTAFAKWLVQKGIASKQERGVGINIWEYGQSYEKKCAHASAMARSLQDQGVKKVRTWTYVD